MVLCTTICASELSQSYYSIKGRKLIEFVVFKKPKGVKALAWIETLEKKRTRLNTKPIDMEIAQTLVGKYGISKTRATPSEYKRILRTMASLVARTKPSGAFELYASLKTGLDFKNPHIQSVLSLNAVLTDRGNKINSKTGILQRHPELKKFVSGEKSFKVISGQFARARLSSNLEKSQLLPPPIIKETELYKKLEPLNYEYKVVRPLPPKPKEEKTPAEKHLDFIASHWTQIDFKSGSRTSILNTILDQFDWRSQQPAENPSSPDKVGSESEKLGFHKFSFPNFDKSDQLEDLLKETSTSYRSVQKAREAIERVIDRLNENVLTKISKGNLSTSPGYRVLTYALLETLFYLKEHSNDHELWLDLFQRLAATGEHCEYGQESASTILSKVSKRTSKKSLDFKESLPDYIARVLLDLRNKIFYMNVANFVPDREHTTTHNNYGWVVYDNSNFGLEISHPNDEDYEYGALGGRPVGYQLTHNTSNEISTELTLKDLPQKEIVKRFFYGKRPGPKDPYYFETTDVYQGKELNCKLTQEERLEYWKTFEGYTPRQIVHTLMQKINGGGPKLEGETEDDERNRLDASKNAKELAKLVSEYIQKNLSAKDIDEWLKRLQKNDAVVEKFKEEFQVDDLDEARSLFYTRRENDLASYKKLLPQYEAFYRTKSFSGGDMQQIPTETAILFVLEKLGYLEKVDPSLKNKVKQTYLEEKDEDVKARASFFSEEEKFKENIRKREFLLEKGVINTLDESMPSGKTVDEMYQEYIQKNKNKQLTEMDKRKVLLNFGVIDTLNQRFPFDTSVDAEYKKLADNGLV